MCRMQHATRHAPVASENGPVTRLRGIADPLERAAAAQTFIVNGRQTLRAAERVRDDAIRQAREISNGTIDDLAGQIGARRNVVVDALRTPKDVP